MRLRFWRRRTSYACGNCHRSFRSEGALLRHRSDSCDQVEMERDLAAWNLRVTGMILDRWAVEEEHRP